LQYNQYPEATPVKAPVPDLPKGQEPIEEKQHDFLVYAVGVGVIYTYICIYIYTHTYAYIYLCVYIYVYMYM